MHAEGETCTGVASCKELGLKLGLDGHECVAVCDVAIEEKTGELRCVGGCPQWYRQVDGKMWSRILLQAVYQNTGIHLTEHLPVQVHLAEVDGITYVYYGEAKMI